MKFANASSALVGLSREIVLNGEEVSSRDGTSESRVLEILCPQIVLESPNQREILTPGRNANVFAQIAETYWVLSGRNDVKWLERYLPRARQFSDDGLTWRGGYGPRLRHWGKEGIDQIQNALSLLKSDRTTRRAVIQIYDPSKDSTPGLDIPCNNWISLVSRKGRLHMMVALRSNDLIWGFSGINAFEWSVLQEIMAGELGVLPGSLVFNTTSLHVYERHWGRMARLAEQEENPHSGLIPSPAYQSAPGTWSPNIQKFMVAEKAVSDVSGCSIKSAMDAVEAIEEPMIRSHAWALAYYWRGIPLPEEYQGTALARAVEISRRFAR